MMSTKFMDPELFELFLNTMKDYHNIFELGNQFKFNMARCYINNRLNWNLMI